MKRIQRRDNLKIYGDLLSALRSEFRDTSGNVVLTRVQIRINVPFDRLKTYIKELVDLELLEDETSLKITCKGMVYLRDYEKVLDFMKRMGISYR